MHSALTRSGGSTVPLSGPGKREWEEKVTPMIKVAVSLSRSVARAGGRFTVKGGQTAAKDPAANTGESAAKRRLSSGDENQGEEKKSSNGIKSRQDKSVETDVLTKDTESQA